jgi:hypothetical protein
MHDNPYAAPRARIDEDDTHFEAADGDDADGERRLLLRREAALRTVGGITLLVSLGILAFATFGVVHELGGKREAIGFVVAGILYVVGSVGAAIGWGLLALRPWAKWVVIAGALPALLLSAPLFPFTAWCLFLVLSAKGRRVLSGEHAGRRKRTPHLHARSWPREAFGVVGALVLNAAVIGLAVWYLSHQPASAS